MKHRVFGEIHTPKFAQLGEYQRLTARFLHRLGAYLATAKNRPSWLFMFVFSRIVVARRMRQLVYRSRNTVQVGDETVFPQIETQSFVNEMKQRGLAKGLMLPPAVLADIKDFSMTAPCFGNSDLRNVFYIKTQNPDQPVDGYIIGDYQDGIADCPAIRQLWDDPALLSIARGYMGLEPHLLRSRLWWSFVAPGAGTTERSEFSQAFHFDLDDWMCCKFFFYITETTAQHGPHQYVSSSHRRRPVAMQVSVFKGQSEATVHRIYGPESVETLVGPAGFGFVEDPFGIHRGTQPTAQARLILEIEYGCTARQPVAGRYGALQH